MPQKTPSFITVRSTSSRLPGKCFLPFGDCVVLEHIIRRSFDYGLDPIVCTTTDDSDDRIVNIANKEGAKVFRGEPIHKLKRWADCCAAFELDAFHTVDADDPFFDGNEMKASFKLLQTGGWDMVGPSESSSAGGATVGYSLTRDIVDRAVALTGANEDTEMMWYWVSKVDGLKKTILPESSENPIVARVTLDYEEDYWFLASIARIVGTKASRHEVDDFLRRNPDFYKINWFRNEEWTNAQASKKV
jgi:spore coat polysaccharide biosynthesis protein SpsF